MHVSGSCLEPGRGGARCWERKTKKTRPPHLPTVELVLHAHAVRPEVLVALVGLLEAIGEVVVRALWQNELLVEAGKDAWCGRWWLW